jgi:predicted TIM-barrel fold metal-dependent hydrolase
MTLYNAHTHVFTIKCTPANFLGKGLIKIISIPIINILLGRLLRKILPGERDFLAKYANFLAIGSNKTQNEVFENLASSYDEYCRFVVLTLDMDYMGAGKAEVNYETQLHQIVRLKMTNMHQVLPFVSVDPRRGSAEYMLEFVKKYIEDYGFCGIKMYPALGFYPFDPNLDLVYKYAEENQIPLMTHCTKGGVHFKGKQLTPQHLWPLNLENEQLPENDHRLDGSMKMSDFKNHFTNPDNYKQVLDKYPNLKFCIAHYGGSDEMLRHFGRGPKKKQVNELGNFYVKTKEILDNPDYPNVYTDISYTLSDDEIFTELIEDIKNPKYQDRILFGTDYFMTIIEKSERRLVDDFRKVIDPTDMKRIGNTNPKNYLDSATFTT